MSVEVVFIVAFLFIIALSFIFVYDFFSDIMEDIDDDPDISDSALSPSQGFLERYPKVFDTGYIIILIGLWLGAIVSAFQVDTYPVFLGISVLALVIVLAVPPVLGNAFEEVFADDSSDGLTDSFPAIAFIMTHILEISIFIGASVILSLYAKSRSGY